MKMKQQSPINLSVKINQFDKVQRELHKLKFQLRMKKVLYDQTEYNTTNNRLQECISYFQKTKAAMIKEEADKILGKGVQSNPSKTEMSRYQNRFNHSKISNRNMVHQLLKKEANYLIQFDQKQQTLSNKKYVALYDLEPIHKSKKEAGRSKKQLEQSSTQRYVSSLQKKIKQQLNKLAIAIDKRQSLILPKTQNRHQKLQSLSSNHRLQNYRQSNKTNISNTQSLQTHRYPKIERCRTDLSQRGKDMIRKVVNQKSIDSEEKNRLLRNYYKKYSQLQDQTALDLMCMASLARADLLLKES